MYKCCACIVKVKKPMGSSSSHLHSAGAWRLNVALRVWRLIVVSTGMSHWDKICFRDLLLSCGGIWRCTQTSRWLYPSLHVHVCVPLGACAGRGCIWSSICSVHQSVWVWKAEQSVSLHKYNMCPEYLEALLSPHWSISTTLPSLPQSGQRTDFPGAHV